MPILHPHSKNKLIYIMAAFVEVVKNCILMLISFDFWVL